MNWMEYVNAFWVGGAICAICQVFIDKTKLTPARILVSLVVIGVFLQAIGIYQPVVDYAGAGATVPLLGFGYSLAKGVAKAVAEKGLLGMFTGGVTGAAGGIAARCLPNPNPKVSGNFPAICGEAPCGASLFCACARGAPPLFPGKSAGDSTASPLPHFPNPPRLYLQN